MMIIENNIRDAEFLVKIMFKLRNNYEKNSSVINRFQKKK